MAMPAKLKIKINLVAFLVGALGLSYLMATQVLSVLQDRYSVYAIFPDAGGVFTNQEVTYRGVTVGAVGSMDVVEDGVKIELEIEDGVDVPEEGIEARVMFKSAVGEQFVDLLPASDDPPYLHDGSEIPIEQTSIPVSTQDLLSTLEAVLRGVPPEALHGAIESLGLGLSGRGSDIATILESTADLSEVFAERAPEIEGILKNGTKVGRAFLQSRRDFIRAVRALVPVSESLRASTPDLHRLLVGSNTTADELLALIRDNRGNLNEALIELAELNKIQAKHADDLNRILAQLPSALIGVNNTFEPATGMVRFSLVTDTDNAACDYGTERRNPEDRSTRLPRKNLRCGGGGASDGRTTNAGAGGDESASDTLLPGVDLDLPELEVDAPKLPPGMADWSWTLFYLNGL
ncbi:MAG: MCE family protein [Actinomycetota bacterium]